MDAIEIKTLFTEDKYSLYSMKYKNSDLSKICTVCNVKLHKSNPGIPCLSCKSSIHVKCSNIANTKNTFYQYYGNWQCSICAKDKFPFHNLKEGELIDLYYEPKQKLTQSVDIRLKKDTSINEYSLVC